MMEIRPIHTDKDHRAALAEIDTCWGAPEGTEEGDRLDVLLALVEIYEAKRWPIDINESFDPIDVLNYAIEELGHTQAELAELLDSRSRASEILSRRRALTVDMIHKISGTWKIPADLLVRPYRIERAAWVPCAFKVPVRATWKTGGLRGKASCATASMLCETVKSRWPTKAVLFQLYRDLESRLGAPKAGPLVSPSDREPSVSQLVDKRWFREKSIHCLKLEACCFVLAR
jgi:HTH-type transcriptional regulator / antitoxin HigA